MIEATVELLTERPVDRITVRDVAARSGHHHRFVAAWFGGKAGLFVAVFEHEIRQLPPPGRAVSESGRLDPRTVRIVHLLNWLVANHPEALADRAGTPLIDAIVPAYRAAGLGETEARLVTQLLLAASAGIVLFGEVLGLQPGDLGRLYELHWRMAVAIADENVTDVP